MTMTDMSLTGIVPGVHFRCTLEVGFVTTWSVKQARQRLSELVDAAERGESTLITRRGRRAASLGPVREATRSGMPDLTEFRASLKVRGKKLAATVIALRKGQRY
jgi:prevent-host-death family protein